MVILYSVRPTDIPAIGINGSNPIFLKVAEIVLSLCADAREKTVDSTIFVRRQTLLKLRMATFVSRMTSPLESSASPGAQ